MQLANIIVLKIRNGQYTQSMKNKMRGSLPRGGAVLSGALQNICLFPGQQNLGYDQN